ncbi:TonB-dependent receptor domain-containing protein [Pandoraea sp. NPDC087047]|uniref:TonB-dependent receptor domain-containing protein n=1 Tax=Pandoraea sp. NPDC087047 TaxID=3364390 RepID=UPI003823B5FF
MTRDLTVTFDTIWQDRRISGGVDVITSTLVLLSNKSVNTPKVVVGSGNLYSPTLNSADNINFSGGTFGDDKLTQRAIFASDRISYGPWSLLAGVRYQSYEEVAHASATAAATNYHASPVTPTVALMFSPRSDLTFYTSYVEALEQGGTANSSTLNANQQMAPIKSRQYEAGVKTELSQVAMAVEARKGGQGGPPPARLTVFVAHDTNISQLRAMLGFDWKLGIYRENDAVPGGTLLFERFVSDRDGKRVVRVSYLAQSLDQTRHLTPLEHGEIPLRALYRPTRGGPAWMTMDRFRARVDAAIDPTATAPQSYVTAQ